MTEVNKYLFQKVGKTFERMQVTPKNAKEARDYYRQIALSTSHVQPKAMISNQPDTMRHDSFKAGSMYLFNYDAKNKDDPKKLPFWDRYPLVFPMEVYGDHLLSINLHYLPPYHRAKLMDALYTTSNSFQNKKKYDDKTILQLSYQMLKGASKFSAFKPCIKMHLFSHIRSSFNYIPPSDWDKILLLPLQRFERKSASAVWNDSLSKIN